MWTFLVINLSKHLLLHHFMNCTCDSLWNHVDKVTKNCVFLGDFCSSVFIIYLDQSVFLQLCMISGRYKWSQAKNSDDSESCWKQSVISSKICANFYRHVFFCHSLPYCIHVLCFRFYIMLSGRSCVKL